MKKLPIASALFTNMIFGAPDVLAATIPVTIDNYNQAVAAKYMGNWDKRGADKAIVHLPILVPAGDKAPVVRMNQDSLYSSAIVRADGNGKVHVGIDEGASVYVSVHVLDENSASPAYFVGAGDHSVKIDTEYAFVIFRAGVPGAAVSSACRSKRRVG